MLGRNNRVSPSAGSIESIDLDTEETTGNSMVRKPRKNIHMLNKFATEYKKVNKRRDKKVLYKDVEKVFSANCGYFTKTKPLSQRKGEKIFSGSVKGMGGCKAYNYHMKQSWRRFKMSCSELGYRLRVWGKSLHWIEGHHGEGVLSYFVFLRWMFGLNILLFIILISFLVIPMAFMPSLNYSASSTDTAVSTAYTCSAAYFVNTTSSAKDLVLGFFQGTGWMEKTYMFYGYYTGTHLLDGTGTTYSYNYNLSFAYIVVSVICLLMCLVIMAKYTAKSFRESIVSDPESSYQYCNMVFGSWDYALNDDKAARIKQRSIYYDIASDLHEERFAQERAEILADPCEKCKLYSIRIIVNFFVLACLGASAYAIFYVTQWSSSYTAENIGATGNMAYVVLLVQYLPSIVLTALNAAVPVIFDIIILAEQYTQAFVIKLTLVRTVFLKLASVAVLVTTLYTEITCSSQDNCGVGTGSCTKIQCWESFVGQQFYKLIIMNFFVTFLKVFYYEVPRRWATTKINLKLLKMIGPCQFNIPQNVLDLVYTQTIVWLGFFFAPMVPVLSVIHLFLVFYSKMFSALYACDPADRPYRASRSSTFFMIVLLVAFFLCAFPVGYTIAVLSPSKSCGPFRTDANMYTVINKTIATWPAWLNSIYDVITSAAVACTIVILLCLVIYYCSALSSAHRENSDHLKEQLAMEGKDKQFLLARITELSGETPKKSSPRKSKAAMGNGVNKSGDAETTFSTKNEEAERQIKKLKREQIETAGVKTQQTNIKPKSDQIEAPPEKVVSPNTPFDVDW